MKTMLSWSRDCHGKVINRHVSNICNTVTSMCGGGRTAEYGMGNTTPYIIEIYEF